MNASLPDPVAADGRVLAACLARLRAALARQPVPPAPDLRGSALGRLCTLLDLGPFERDLLLLAAGPELDGAFAAAMGGPPTFGLALAVLPDAHWSAMLPGAPLRRWGLLAPDGAGLAHAPLRVPETVLHALAGVPCLDAAVLALAHPAPPAGSLPPAHAALAGRLAELWAADGPPLQLCGPADAGGPAMAAAAAAALGLRLYILPAAALLAPERGGWLRAWRRDALLTGSALLVDLAGADAREWLLALRGLGVPALLMAEDPVPSPDAPLLRLDVPRPSAAEQAALWAGYLGAGAEPAFGPVMGAFDLGPAAIAAAAAAVAAVPPEERPARLWAECRAQARAPLEGLARRIEPQARWDDLVLPEDQAAALRAVADQVRHRRLVLDGWGMGARSRAGLGTTALLAGPPGTGKTLAAEVLAAELGRDLYAVDLSAVTSKWLGETEANLRRIFAAAEAGGAVLLFDEADALFGTRTEVKDGHDRYANLGVSYLLQRVETFRGLVLLATNMKDALDRAFLRRLRFVVDFPHPDAAERERLWRRAFPPSVPLDGVAPERLAQLNLPGGHIRTIALNAAFRAAAAGAPVGMAHLLEAARAECAKLGRPLGAAEVQGWL